MIEYPQKSDLIIGLIIAVLVSSVMYFWSSIESFGLYRIGYIIAFLLLVVLPIYIERDSFIDRISDISNNYKYIIYSPIAFSILIVTLIFAFWLSNQIPILKWGWLGSNIVASPAGNSVEAMANSGQSFPIFSIIKFTAFITILVIAIVIFNYLEEEEFRDSYKEVGLWAALHLIMGIPIFAVIPIFSVGIFYKIIYDKKGLKAAYVVHLSTNMILVTLLIISAGMATFA